MLWQARLYQDPSSLKALGNVIKQCVGWYEGCRKILLSLIIQSKPRVWEASVPNSNLALTSHRGFGFFLVTCFLVRVCFCEQLSAETGEEVQLSRCCLWLCSPFHRGWEAAAFQEKIFISSILLTWVVPVTVPSESKVYITFKNQYIPAVLFW